MYRILNEDQIIVTEFSVPKGSDTAWQALLPVQGRGRSDELPQSLNANVQRKHTKFVPWVGRAIFNIRSPNVCRC